MPPFVHRREMPASPDAVFAAFADPAKLAHWWGPAGFTNTFSIFDFQPGGRWVYVMHGPDGKNYPNESRFAEVQAGRRIVIDHVAEPKYRLSIDLTAVPAGTLVTWVQEFEREAVAEAIAPIVRPANEENLQKWVDSLGAA